MSAIIRQQLTPMLGNLTNGVADKANLPNEPEFLGLLGEAADTLSHRLNRVQSLLKEWTAILTGPDPDLRKSENTLFEAFTVEGESPGVLLAEAMELQSKLDIKIDLIKAAIPPPAGGGVPTSAARPLINLPSLQLPDFDGTDSAWPSFWAAFSHTIHDNPALTGSQKLTYLVGRLKSGARTLVDGFALTDVNYSIVVDLLKSRFGDEAKRADRLRSELFHLPKPTAHSSSLRSFSESVERICRQLEGLGTNLDNNPFLTVAIKEKLPTEVKAQLYDKELESGGTWNSKEWRDRLSRVVRLKESVHAPWEPQSAPNPGHMPKPPPPRTTEAIRRSFPVVEEAEKGAKPVCSLCLRGGHKPSRCPTYQSAEQRVTRLAEQGRCTRCARDGHRVDACPSKATCFRCGENHHVLVCDRPDKWAGRGSNSVPLGPRNSPKPLSSVRYPHHSLPVIPIQQQEGPPEIASVVAENVCTVESLSSSKDRPAAYLMITEISVFKRGGPPIRAPVFFDPGSQPSFITSSLVSQLNPDWIIDEKMVVGGFVGDSAHRVQQLLSPRFSIRLKRKDGGWETVEVNQTPKIVPPVEFLREVQWTPANPNEMGVAVKEPQILLGIREFWRFFVDKKEVFPGLFRINTVFGSMLGGQLEVALNPVSTQPSVCYPLICGATVHPAHPEELIRQLWSLESIGIRDPLDPNDAELALNLFKHSVRFKEGRYEVGWPWRPGAKERLPTNFSLAYSRLSNLSKKLVDDPGLRSRYQAVIDDQFEKGIIEPARRNGACEHFIPHHPVITPKKLRVVYDASAHEKGKASLNELLLPGPNLVPELAGILIRFRASPFPVLGDIEQAFLAVGLREEDREVAKFLWLKNPAIPLSPENLAIFRFKRIAFGVNASPFLLASVLQHHLLSRGDPLGMVRNFYVDNLLICSDTAEEAAASVRTAREMMSGAGMHLREFVATDPSILADMPPEDVLVGHIQKVLGIPWDLQGDRIRFEFPKGSDFPPTRRGVLSAIASLFDPLGLCSPCLVRARVFFQSLWDLKTGWDEPLTEPLRREWEEISSEWDSPPLTFSRLTPHGHATLQLHVFSDAGPNSFATAVYLRADGGQRPLISLLFAKSRLRPKKFRNDGLTIPRLELLGLTIAIRAKTFLLSNFDYPFEKIFFWVDSQIVLSWICGSAQQPVFIANRLTEIRKERDAFFRYVRSADNPADLGTRGIPPRELGRSELWMSGPGWLQLPEQEWPNEFRDVVLPTDEPTPMEEPAVLQVAAVVPAQSILPPSRFSNWSRLLRTTTLVLCFLSKLLGKGSSARGRLSFISQLNELSPFSSAARKVVRGWIIGREQQKVNVGEGCIRDADGLIRLRTRLALARQPKDFINPLVLPRESWVTRLLILSAHTSLAHAGVDFTLSKFLREFWCVRARRLVKKILHQCPVCRRDKAVKFSLPPMPPLPTVRVNPSPPFTFIGLDYLGPTQFKFSDGPKKAWILLLTCLSCRAIHLEVVDSLSATDFLSAFRRFVARRGSPKRIWSDNGTQLVLGRQILMTYCDFPVEWKLIPPHCPWAGGFYERLVGLVKTAFRRCLGRSTPTWGQLLTLTCEVEAILNHRPITFVSDEPNGPLPLRPIDFLTPRSANVLEEPDEPDPFNPSPPEKLAQLWYITNEALRRFWRTWSQEYLLLLRGRTQTTHVGPRVFAPETPSIGDIVLVEVDEFPRNHWPLGRITALNPLDKPRSAKLLMSNGREWERPVNQLVPLEGTARGEEVSDPHSPTNTEDTAGNENGPEASLPHPSTSSVSAPPLPITPGDAVEVGEAPVGEERATPKLNRASARPRAGQRVNERPVVFHWASRPPRAKRRINWSPRNSLVTPLMFIVPLIAFLSGVSASPPPLTCDERGVWVFLNPKAENALVCCEGICSSRSYRTPYLLPLPPDLLVSGYDCHVSFSILGEKFSTQVQCAPVEGCSLISCYFCWERVLNPHCSPFLLAFGLGTLVGAIGIVLCVGFLVFRALRQRGLRVHWSGACPDICRRCFRIRRAEGNVAWRRAAIEDSDDGILFPPQPAQLEAQNRGESPVLRQRSTSRGRAQLPRISRVTYALAQIVLGFLFLSLLPSPVYAGLEVIPLAADTEECMVDNASTECRFNQVTSLTLLPVGHRVELILHTPHAVPMGSLLFALHGLEIHCNKESGGWTRSYRVMIAPNLRCHLAGSCTGSFCADLTPQQVVPELKEEFPGNNYCREASGFIRKGCLSPAYACLFYRIYAKPTSRYLYEVFKCPTWQFALRMGVTLELKSTSFSEEIVMFPGITHHWSPANLSLTFSPSGLPPWPVLGGIFLANATHAVLAREWHHYLQCDSLLAAQALNCTLALEVCKSCHVHHEAASVNCNCMNSDIEKMMAEPLLRLPNSLGHLQIGYINERIRGTFPYSPIHLIVKMTGTQLATQHSIAKCTVTPGKLMGCHSCRTGGRFSYVCSSSFGEAFASIRCEDGSNWVSRCTPRGYHSSVVLTWSHPQISTLCTADCLGGLTSFRLEGTLIFFLRREGDYSPIVSDPEKGGPYPGGITFPQVKFALFQSVGSLPQAMIVVTVGVAWAVLFLLGVRFFPATWFVACCCPTRGTAAAATVLANPPGGRSRPRRRRPHNRNQTM